MAAFILPAELEFLDDETEERITQQTISDFDSTTIRVQLKPGVVGELGCTVLISNALDPLDKVQVQIHALVRSAPGQESILIKPNTQLDFGDCYVRALHAPANLVVVADLD